MRSRLAMAIGSLLVALSPGMAAGEEPAPDPAGYRIEEVATGLAFPWSLAFLPSGDLLVTERNGGLQRFTWNTLSLSPIGGLPDDIFVRSQGGLFDVVLAPDFEHSRILYLSYAHGTRKANATRVARAKLSGKQLTNFEVLFTAKPPKDTPAHFGGRMAFLPDGTLLLTLGDGFVYREKAQDLSSHLGKIVRIAADGSVPAGNPFAGQTGALPEIWSYGHRNVQAILVEPGTGRVYAHEHGPRGGDEINLIEPGTNYGWPVITYGIDYSGAIISPYTEREGMAQPLFQWTPSIAPAGMTLYSGSRFPEWEGDLLVAALSAKRVERIDLEDGKVVGRTALFSELGKRIRDVRTAPDGAVFLLTDEPDGNILRVVPQR